MAVEVKFGRVPGRLQEATLLEGSTVRESLRVLEITVASDEVVSVNGSTVELDDTIDADTRTITVAKRVKGNHIPRIWTPYPYTCNGRAPLGTRPYFFVSIAQLDRATDFYSVR